MPYVHPGPHLQILLGVSRPELVIPGWGLTRLAAGFRFSRDSARPGEGWANPEGLWAEPNTGILFLAPSFVRADSIEDDWYDQWHYGLGLLEVAQWTTGGSPVFSAAPRSSVRADGGKFLLFVKPASETSVIEVAASLALTVVLANQFGDLKWLAKTKDPLHPNEGWGVNVDPAGISGDRALQYMCIGWGERFLLALRMNGVAELYENLGGNGDGVSDEPEPDWIHRESFQFSQGGIEHRRPFSIRCIPWGPAFLSFIFTQEAATSGGRLTAASGSSRKETAFMVDLRKWGWDPEEHHSVALGQVVKQPAGHLHVALRLDFHQYRFSLFRIRYRESQTVVMLPEDMILPRPDIELPDVILWGYQGQKLGTGAAASITEPTVLNEKGEAWDPETDTKIMFRFQMNPSDAGVYSPEVWYITYRAREKIIEPAWTPQDVAPMFQMVRTRHTASLEGSTLELKLARPTTADELTNLYRMGVPVEIKAEVLLGVDPGGEPAPDSLITIFEGYITDRLPTVRGASRRQLDELEGVDLWDRLNNTPLQYEVALDQAKVGDVLRQCIERAGFPDEQIEIDDDLINLDIPTFSQTNQIKSFTPGTSCGDAIREIAGRFGMQGRTPMRVRRILKEDGTRVWRAYIAPLYTPGETPVTKLFLLDHTLVPLIDSRGRSDTERWNLSGEFGAEQYFLIKSDAEPWIKRPESNAALFAAADGTAGGAERLEYLITPHPDVLDDPTKWAYEGSLRSREYGPPEITAQTQEELERQGRFMYEQFYSGLLTHTCWGEWQPGLEVDDFVAVIGRNMVGAPVSYGCFRIHTMDVEIRYDHAHNSGLNNTRYDWGANYTLVYAGPTLLIPYPMFSDKLPEVPGA